MKNQSFLFRLVVLVSAMMCAFGASAAEAYANYIPLDGTLTFYYDNQRSSRPNATYDLNTGSNYPDWCNDAVQTYTTRVIFDPSFAAARPTTTYKWFDGMRNLQSFTGLSNLNTSEVTNMAYMFAHCYKLTSLDLSSFNTSNVTNMERMFLYSSELTSLKLSSFNTSLVTNMEHMFAHCNNLKTIYVDNEWSTSAVTASTEMFVGCYRLEGGQGTTYNAYNPNDKTYAHIDGGTSNPGYLTANIQAYACYTWDYKVLSFYFDDMRAYRMGRTYNLNTGENYPGWYTDGTCANVTRVVFDTSFADYRPTTTYSWFSDMANLQTILGISNLNTSEVTDMGNMFRGCTGLTSLDLSSFNTSKVTDMTEMFRYSSSLLTIIVGSGWSTASVTSSTRMFGNCTSLVGGQGTTYDANHTDAAYAHIDGGASNPGYFTRGPNEPETYACYTSENTTLTFYYDTDRSSRTGKKYNLNPDSNDPGWYTDTTYANVTNVVFDPSFANARPTSTYKWFYGMRNLQSFTGLSNLNTSEVTNMSYMFCYCTKLTSLDLSHFNTSKVTFMYGMFYGSSGLTSLDLSSFNTTKVTGMTNVFVYCSNLRTITVGSDWRTSAVTSSSNMFNNNTSLVGGMGTTYNDSNPKDKAYAHIDGGASNPGYFTAAGTQAYAVYTPENTTLTFYYDTERSSRTGKKYNLNTSGSNPAWYTDGTYANVTRVVFDPSFAGARPTTTYSWFYEMQNLQTITGIEHLNTSEVISLSQMFFRCNKLTSIDVSHFNTSKLKTLWAMFYNCSGLTSLDLSSFNTSMVTNTGYMFNSCSNLRTIYVGEGWSTAAVTGSVSMFTDCSSLVGGMGTVYDANHVDKAYAHIDGGVSDPGYFTAAGIEAYACYTPENTTLTFYYDTERGTRPGTTYDLNTGMNTPAWRSVGSHVTQVVFDPSFANARLTTTYSWFYGMQNLQTIEGMEYLNTSEVTDIAYMFGWCTSLTSLDLSHFNTSKVTNMGYMFYYCESLTSLDLSSFITSMVTNTGFMFYGCSNLRTIYASEGWSTAAVTSSSMMFYGCTSLVGGQGTTYDANHIDKTYAHIDGGASNPGYFTDKNASLRGDVNGDGSVNIADVTDLIDYLLTSDASGISLSGADTNQDGVININDVAALIDNLLTGAW
jgi:surface protein